MKQNILKKIIKEKIKWISYRKKIQPLKKIASIINIKTRDLYKSITKKKPSFILECKKSSPSFGIIKKKFNILKIAQIYKKYASAISVVTEEKYFNGNIENIPKIKKIVHQPILCKDFIIDPYQIYLAKYYQADAILLMLSILNDNQYYELSKLAKYLNLQILTEVHNLNELERLKKFSPKIIGINNRNLKNLKINIKNTIKLAPLIKKKTCIISESGITTNFEVKKLNNFVNGFLIGTQLMKKKNLDLEIRKIIYGKNKICGLTRHKDAYNSSFYGSVYGGLIFCKNSLRKINIKKAKTIIKNINLKFVGVFQNKNLKSVTNIVNKLKLNIVQLHGNENKEYISSLKNNISKKIKIWKSITLQQFLSNFYKIKYINYYLLDNNLPGSGIQLNWKPLKHKNLNKIILAGGLNQKNIKLAMKLNSLGLDINSGVEKYIGIKSRKKIKLIFKNLRYY
ncbi:bifunctional indole-3-glycerol-phosphate synthase TrpC/phosphoribosylanthranilate isomerase TrpF [Buchnera aphidicola]|uniref:bifunctional indole-3-glycerol-phosphate synthase TrpC/phosphoribosylanthranilate isomerase TrpF n=1 Tax=Buchnera aphidicola TaxID=9 RepID=UPI0030ED28CC